MAPIISRYGRTCFLLHMVFGVGFLFHFVSTSALAQDPAEVEHRIVSDIVVIGNRLVPDGVILQQVRNVRINQPLILADLQRDLDNLKLMGQFTEVFATTEFDNGDIVVVFHVVEKPSIRAIHIEGAERVRERDLRNLLNFRVGDPMDLLRIRNGTEVIAERYRERGFTEVSVTLDEQALNDGVVIYEITEGPRVRVRNIRFQGNRSFSDRRLIGQIQTRTYIWLLRAGTYSENQAQDDIASLRNFYRTEGFLDVQVGREIEISPDRERMTVIFVLDEGVRYQVNSIRVEGNTHFTDEQILACLELASGSTLNLDRLEGDRKRVTQLYGGDGYIYSSTDAVYSFAETPGMVDIRIRIDEGNSYNIGRIVIRGNERTQDRVIRRVLEFYPSQTFDLNRMQDRERRLRETRLFREVSITPVPGEFPDEHDALVQVEEAHTTRVMAGIGVTSNAGIVGNFTIENWNFDLFDRPRTFSEFLRGQAFKGAGQTLRLSFEPGTEMTSFRIDFTEPYLLDMPLTFGWSAYLFTRDREGYDENRLGTLFSFSKQFRDIYSVGTTFRVERIDIDNIERHFLFFAPKDILDVKDSSLLTSIRLSAARDTTDSIFLPSTGTRLEASWEQAGAMGGDYTFSRIIAQAIRYQTLRTDVYDRKTIWGANVSAGYIIGDAPVFERFYGGGIGSIRGFEYRGVSPRQWPRRTPIGGNSQLLVGNEVSFPLVGQNLRGVTFLDMGSVNDNFSFDSWRAAIGFGVRLTVDFFGPIPMAFDFAVPISKDRNDDTEVFSFSLGATFR